MSYKPLPFTYGAMTVAERDAITGSIVRGSTVFNTESQMIETWSGRLWVDDRSVEFKIKSTTTAVLGNLMKTDSTGLIDLCDNTAAERQQFCGVIVAGPVSVDSEGQGGFAAVAHAGKVKALAGGDIQSGRWALVDSVAGRYDDTTFAGAGAIGLCMEGTTAGNLGTIALQTIELA